MKKSVNTHLNGKNKCIYFVLNVAVYIWQCSMIQDSVYVPLCGNLLITIVVVE